MAQNKPLLELNYHVSKENWRRKEKEETSPFPRELRSPNSYLPIENTSTATDKEETHWRRLIRLFCLFYFLSYNLGHDFIYMVK